MPIAIWDSVSVMTVLQIATSGRVVRRRYAITITTAAPAIIYAHQICIAISKSVSNDMNYLTLIK
jgi:hypothetical protein